MMMTLKVLMLLTWMANAALSTMLFAEDVTARTTRAPELRGQRINLARQLARLANLEFLSGKFYIAPDHWNDDLKLERVYLQTPQASSPISIGAPVVCWSFEKAAPGTPVVNVPQLTNESLVAAQNKLKDVGLTLINQLGDRPIDSDSSLRVLEQYPRAGQSVFAGTSIFLRLGQRQEATNPGAPANSTGQATGKKSSAGLSVAESANPSDVSVQSVRAARLALPQVNLLVLAVGITVLIGMCFLRRFRSAMQKMLDCLATLTNVRSARLSYCSLTCLLFCASWMQLSEFALAEQYYLEDPRNPKTQLIVDVTDEELVVYTNPNTLQQRKYSYERFALLDTSDHLTYYRDASNMYIRWPIGGQGSVVRMVGGGNWQEIPQRIVGAQSNYGSPWSFNSGTSQSYPGGPLNSPPPTEVTELVANQPLQPVTIELTNTHDKTVIASLIDRRTGARRAEFTLHPGDSASAQVERDAGATQQTVLVAYTGERLGVINQQSVAAQPLYKVVVFEHTVVSTYIDRTGKDKLVPERFRPPAESYGARSIGEFALPAGELLSDGTSIDVYGEANSRRNPGAAGRYSRILK
jgi:PASTA domain